MTRPERERVIFFTNVMDQFIPIERVEQRIFVIRGQKVMLDRDLAELYGVPTKVLNQAVKRNPGRFPSDFMFILSEVEAKTLRSQFVTSKSEKRGGTQYQIYAFTEQGVAMLSSVLRSEQAILINIAIIPTFVRMRQMIAGSEELRLKVEAMEKQYDEHFREVFTALRKVCHFADAINMA